MMIDANTTALNLLNQPRATRVPLSFLLSQQFQVV